MAVVLWVTTNCNLNCKYCYEGEDKPKITMTKETIEKSIKFISSNIKNSSDKKIVIPIHGGEPLLEYEAMKFIVNRCREEFKDKEITFPFTTNGTILNEEILDFIINEAPDITLSLDGARDTHDKMRKFKNGSNTHDIVLKNGKKLLKHLPDMRIRMTFDSETVSTLYDDVKFLIEEGFRVIVPAPNIFDKRWEYKHLKILEGQMIKIKTYIEKLENIAVSIVDKDLYTNKGPCNAGVNNFSIYSDGSIYPCTLVAGNEEFCIGNIYTNIDNQKVEELLSYSKYKNKECKDCGLEKYCSGERCKIVNKLITGDYYSPPPMECAMERLKYRVNFNKIM